LCRVLSVLYALCFLKHLDGMPVEASCGSCRCIECSALTTKDRLYLRQRWMIGKASQGQPALQMMVIDAELQGLQAQQWLNIGEQQINPVLTAPMTGKVTAGTGHHISATIFR